MKLAVSDGNKPCCSELPHGSINVDCGDAHSVREFTLSERQGKAVIRP
jgi:hypothetical protein